MDSKRLMIPRRLDDPPRFFFWEFDVAVVFMTIMMFGIVVGAFIVPLLIAIATSMAFAKVKSGQQRGYGIHVMYWHLPVTLGFKRTPASCVREFVG